MRIFTISSERGMGRMICPPIKRKWEAQCGGDIKVEGGSLSSGTVLSQYVNITQRSAEVGLPGGGQ